MRFIDFFEFFFCIFISLVAVRMIFHGELFVCFFDISIARILRDSEYGVVVFIHNSEKYYLYFMEKRAGVKFSRPIFFSVCFDFFRVFV